jgi:hypothetical protein
MMSNPVFRHVMRDVLQGKLILSTLVVHHGFFLNLLNPLTCSPFLSPFIHMHLERTAFISPFANVEYIMTPIFSSKDGVQSGNHGHGGEEGAKAEPHSVRDDIVNQRFFVCKLSFSEFVVSLLPMIVHHFTGVCKLGGQIIRT